MLNQAKQNAAEYIRQNADVFQSVSDYIWQNPELSLQEFKATQRFCAELRNEGFTVTENLCGIPTAFCGSWGSGRPVIGILGEYDALSGLSQVQGITHQQSIVPGGSGHGCGHNMLGAGALGAAYLYLMKREKELDEYEQMLFSEEYEDDSSEAPEEESDEESACDEADAE